MSQYWYISIHNLFKFPQCLTSCPFLLWDPITDTTLYLVFRLLLATTVSQAFFVFDKIWEIIAQVFCRMSHNLDFSDDFLMIGISWWDVRKMTTWVKDHCNHILSRLHITHMTHHWWCWPWSLDWGSICQIDTL